MLRHIAGPATENEQRCIRCCEIIVRRGPQVNFCAWPGSKIVMVGDRMMFDHPAAKDCTAVDLEKREKLDLTMAHIGEDLA